MRYLKLLGLLPLMVILLMISGCTTVEVGELQTESVSVELENADSVDVELDMSRGEMNIAGGADKLLDAEFRYNVAAWKPEIEYNVIEDKGKLIVRQPREEGIVGSNATNEWDLRLNEDVPMDLSIDVSNGNCDLNMDSALLKTLEIDSSNGNVDVTLIGNQSLLKSVNMDMSSGSASLDLSGDYPSLSAMVIKSKNGDVDTDLTGTYSAMSSVDIDVSNGNVLADLTGHWGSDAQVKMIASSGQITLRLPQDVGVYVEASASNGKIEASGFRMDGDNYVNHAYGESNVTINVKATVKNGNIELLLVD